LRDNFSQDEIDGFYLAFKDQFEALEKLNPDAVDILFSAINFTHFKDQMIKFKKALDAEGKFKDQTTKTTLNL